MIALPKENKVFTPAVSADSKHEWVRPEIARISAGSAEQGSSFTTDIGVNFS
jgi:hypothetical protein